MSQPSFAANLANHSLIRFAGVGAVSTILDILFLNLGRKFGLSVGFATALGFIVGSTNGYLMNTFWVFTKDADAVRYTKYLALSAGGLLWTELIVHALDQSLTLNGAKLVAVAVVFFWNYTLSKMWAFK